MKTKSLIVFGFAVCINAGIINVPDEQPTIQLAITAAIPGDTVLVQPGEYTENIVFSLCTLLVLW
jgi:hypothetical protein